MTSWRYLYHADQDYGDALADSFVAQVAYVARSERRAAVYRCRLADGAAHYYFSPAASLIAERFFARPCSTPLPEQRGERLAGQLDPADII